MQFRQGCKSGNCCSPAQSEGAGGVGNKPFCGVHAQTHALVGQMACMQMAEDMLGNELTWR